MTLKILIYSPKFYPSVGGLENITLMLAKQFVAEGHYVKVICFEKNNSSSCGIETFYSPDIKTQALLFIWADIFYMPNLSLKGLWLFAINPFKRWVVSHNGWYGNSGLGGKKGINERFKLFLTRFSKNIYVSNAVASYVQSKGVVIHNCYDNKIFKTSVAKDKNILFVGRLVSDKGVDILLEACLFLWQKNASFTVTIVGDGEMRNWINDFCDKHSLQNQVVLKGTLVGEELAKEIGRHRVMVVPSRIKEGFGIVALEGLACGCQIICADNGGLPEAVGKFGLLFPENNSNELAARIQESIDNYFLYSTEDLNLFLGEHLPQRIASQYLKVFGDK